MTGVALVAPPARLAPPMPGFDSDPPQAYAAEYARSHKYGMRANMQTAPQLPYSYAALGGALLGAAGSCAVAIAFLETRYARSARPPGIVYAEVALGVLGGASGVCGAAILRRVLRPEPDRRRLVQPPADLAQQADSASSGVPHSSEAVMGVPLSVDGAFSAPPAPAPIRPDEVVLGVVDPIGTPRNAVATHADGNGGAARPAQAVTSRRSHVIELELAPCG